MLSADLEFCALENSYLFRYFLKRDAVHLSTTANTATASDSVENHLVILLAAVGCEDPVTSLSYEILGKKTSSLLFIIDHKGMLIVINCNRIAARQRTSYQTPRLRFNGIDSLAR